MVGISPSAFHHLVELGVLVQVDNGCQRSQSSRFDVLRGGGGGGRGGGERVELTPVGCTQCVATMCQQGSVVLYCVV